jgi:hypothetical protein
VIREARADEAEALAEIQRVVPFPPNPIDVGYTIDLQN